MCDQLNVANNAKDDEKVHKHQQEETGHLADAKRAQDLIKLFKANNDRDVDTIVMDLQQTLPMQRLSSSIAYYKLKLGLIIFA